MTETYQVGDRVCNKCGHTGAIDDFVKAKQCKYGRANLCHACGNAYQRKHWHKDVARSREVSNSRQRRLRRRIAALKDAPCVDCGVKFPFCAMEFDHCNGEKEFELAKAGGMKWERILAEVQKCQLVCANCHKVRTWKRSNSIEIQPDTHTNTEELEPSLSGLIEDKLFIHQ